MKLKIMLVLAAAVVVAVTACKSVHTTAVEPKLYPAVSLPGNFKNAEPSPQLDESAVVLSVLDSSNIWVGPNEFPERHAFDVIEKRVNDARQKLVYIRAVGTVEYSTLLKAIDTARRAGALDFALQVLLPGTEHAGQFSIKVLPPPAGDSVGKKNSELLGVILSADAKLSLVKGGVEDGPVGPSGTTEEMGTPRDTARLMQALTEALADRTDRKVTIKALPTVSYNDLVTIIDAVKGAGARPIVLQIDDLF